MRVIPPAERLRQNLGSPDRRGSDNHLIAVQNKRARHISMTRFAGAYQLTTISTAEAQLPTLLIGMLRIVSCVVLVLVLSLFAAPNSAQAHGLHGSQSVTAPIYVTDTATQTVASDRSASSASKCITCCASSACAAISIPDAFELSGSDVPTNDFWAASTVEAYQTALLGLRRPPRLNS